MILFYDKKTGKIVGNIEGRIHGKDHLDVWIGSEKDNARMVVDWERVGEDEKNHYFRPKHQQREIFISLDSGKTKIFDYKVNCKTKRLELKSENGVR